MKHEVAYNLENSVGIELRKFVGYLKLRYKARRKLKLEHYWGGESIFACECDKGNDPPQIAKSHTSLGSKGLSRDSCDYVTPYWSQSNNRITRSKPHPHVLQEKGAIEATY